MACDPHSKHRIRVRLLRERRPYTQTEPASARGGGPSPDRTLAAAGGLAASIASGDPPAGNRPNAIRTRLSKSSTQALRSPASTPARSNSLQPACAGPSEGPVYFPEERYLLVSDIPNNR